MSDNTAVLNGDALGENTGDSLTTPPANRSAVLMVTVWGRHLVKGEITCETSMMESQTCPEVGTKWGQTCGDVPGEHMVFP